MKRILRVGEGSALTNHKRKRYTIRYISLLAVLTSMCLYAVKQASAQQAEPAATAVVDTTASVRDTLAIEEVQINTGYQRIPKERATGSFVFVDSALLNRAVSTDIISRLKGVVPSLLFDERAGGDPKLSIRGRSTIFANADPLIVVDNFPYEGDIRNINPNDVESVSILRDAAAASIWGVRAGNGVIVITTKKGKAGQPLQVSFNGNVTVGEKPDLWYEPRISTSDFIEVERFLFDNGYFNTSLNNAVNPPALSPVVELLAAARDGELIDAEVQEQIEMLKGIDYRNDLNRYFYRNRVNQQYALNVSGSGEKHQFFYSANMDRNADRVAARGYKRLSLSTNQTLRLTPTTEVEGNLSYTYSTRDSHNDLDQLNMGVRDLYPYAQLADSDGKALPITKGYRQKFLDDITEKGLLDWNYFPLDELNHSTNRSERAYVRAAAGLRQRILNGLHFSAKYQFERQFGTDNIDHGSDSYFVRDLINRFSQFTNGDIEHPIPEGGILTNSVSETDAHNFRITGSYEGRWQGHVLNVFGGFEIRQVKNSGDGYWLYGFDENTGLTSPVNHDILYAQFPTGLMARVPTGDRVSGILDRYRSYFTNLAYVFRDRYTFTASGRIDQSNLFGVKANQRSVPLWSSGVLWDIQKENFVNIPWISLLRMRASYGFNGNLDQGMSAYTTARYYSANLNGKRYASVVTPPNPNLRWEKTGLLNVGLEIETKDRRIGLSFEYFYRRGDGLIGNEPLDPTSGLSTFRGNVANMESKGLDLLVNTVNTNGNLHWSTRFAFSNATEKVTNYNTKPLASNYLFIDGSVMGYTAQLAPNVGKPLFGVYSYHWGGLDAETGNPLGYLDNVPSTDYSRIISAANSYDSLIYHGRATPSVFGSLMNTFAFKGFSLSVNLTYKFGYWFRRSSVDYNMLFSTYNGHADYARRWQKKGDEARTHVPSMIYPLNRSRETFYSRSSVLVERGDHIRLQDVQLTYELPFAVVRQLGLQSVKLYAYVANVGVIWRANKVGLDPDYATTRLTGSRGLVLPEPTTYALGINVSFN